MDKKILPRDAGGAFELPEGTGSITRIYTYGSFLEMHKIDKTYRVESPNKIDPERKNPNAAWVNTPVSNIDSQNPIISRLLLQSDQMLDAAWFEHEIDKNEVKRILYACKEDLLVCDQIAKKIALEVDKIISKVQSKSIIGNGDRAINPFPHVPDLVNNCDTF